MTEVFRDIQEAINDPERRNSQTLTDGSDE